MPQLSGKKKKHKKGEWMEFKEPPLRSYKLAVFLPEKDPQTFIIQATDFEYKKHDEVHFYKIGPLGMKEFVASFRYVVYIVLEDPNHP